MSPSVSQLRVTATALRNKQDHNQSRLQLQQRLDTVTAKKTSVTSEDNKNNPGFGPVSVSLSQVQSFKINIF